LFSFHFFCVEPETEAWVVSVLPRATVKPTATLLFHLLTGARTLGGARAALVLTVGAGGCPGAAMALVVVVVVTFVVVMLLEVTIVVTVVVVMVVVLVWAWAANALANRTAATANCNILTLVVIVCLLFFFYRAVMERQRDPFTTPDACGVSKAQLTKPPTLKEAKSPEQAQIARFPFAFGLFNPILMA